MRILLGRKRTLKGRIPGISSCFLDHSIENTKQTMIPATVYSVKWCPTLCDPMNYKVRGILQARILGWVAFPFPRGSSRPRDRTQSPSLQTDSLPAEPPGQPRNTGVGSLSLLQYIFLTQPRSGTRVSCIAGGFFINWAVREVPYTTQICQIHPGMNEFSVVLPVKNHHH